MKVAGVILAAGASTRLGQPKQLVRVAGERLLERAVRVAVEAGCDPVLVVLGASAEVIANECEFGRALIVWNEAWTEGMASSIRAGIAALRHEVHGAILMTCDQPAVTAEHLRQLAGGDRMASQYAGRRGVPAYFPASDFKELLLLTGDAGARTLLANASTIELPGGHLDVDTEESLKAARSAFGE
jgi:molybdenum cofactor cytidylyltransferase